jgi:hypothetical protein
VKKDSVDDLLDTSDPLGGLPAFDLATPHGSLSGTMMARVVPRESHGGSAVVYDVAPPPASPRSQPNGDGGGVRAGEWDDNANYREFQRYLRSEASSSHHNVDIGDRSVLVVRDADGKAVPRCRVEVRDAEQHAVALLTSTAGRAWLFPHAEGLRGRELTAVASCLDTTAQSRVRPGGDAPVDLKLAAPRALPSVRAIDVAFILDTTGSMNEEIDAVKQTLRAVARGLAGADVRVRVGMVEYKDRGDVYVTRVRRFSEDVPAFSRAIGDIAASGGGDGPESVNEALHVAVHELDWSADAIGRFAFLVGDAPPHLDYPGDFDYAAEMKTAAHRGIQIFTVAASGMNDLGQAVWRQIAQYTGGTNLFVLRGGAGPQSTGAGDPKSSCGGRQKSYTSGNLDALLLGIIHRQLRALDGDPLRIAGLKADESAKQCPQEND